MKKVFFYSVLFATVLIMASCKKETIVVDYLPATISHYQSGNDSKVFLVNEVAYWNDEGDVVNLNGSTSEVFSEDGYYKIAVDADARSIATTCSTYYAIFPASIVDANNATTHTIILPHNQHYVQDGNNRQKINAPMAASGSTRMQFKNLCGLLKVTVTGLSNVNNEENFPDYHLTMIEVTTVGGAVLSGTGTVTFPSTSTIDADPTLTMSSVENGGIKKTILQFDENGYKNGDYYIAIPHVTNDKFIIRVSFRQVVDGNTVNTYTKTFVQESACSLEPSHFGPVAASTVNATQIDHLPGAFTTGDGVIYFSRGVLKCENGSNGVVWSFENNQYSATPYVGHSHNFTHSGFMPYSTENNHSGFPILSNSNSGNFWEWGQHISSNWSTLSRADWDMLLNERSASTLNGRSNARYAYANVNGQYGLMLFPDLFLWPESDAAPGLIGAANINATNVASNDAPNYTLAQWKELEDAGCVFLPALGYYTFQTANGSYQNVNEGWYWTSDTKGSNEAYYMHFPSVINYHPAVDGVTNDNNDYNHMPYCSMGYGLLVRLVYQY